MWDGAGTSGSRQGNDLAGRRWKRQDLGNKRECTPVTLRLMVAASCEVMENLERIKNKTKRPCLENFVLLHEPCLTLFFTVYQNIW